MENCIFCKIVNKELSSENIVYEDEQFVAFLDIRPLSPGHTLVVPKKHYRFVWDVPNVGEYFEVARKIALAQKKAFGVDIIMSKVIGEEIHHAHIWVFPDPEFKGEKGVKWDKEDFKGNAEKIRRVL